MSRATAVVSVDLAYKSYASIGVAVLERTVNGVRVTMPTIDLTGVPDPAALGAYLIEICRTHGSNTLLIDGPQAWKDPDNGLEHSRRCEKQLNTPAKTGLPGFVKPKPYTPFVSFSVEVFDWLQASGWARLQQPEHPAGPVVAESFPYSAWKSLGLKSLPAKSKCNITTLHQHIALLQKVARLEICGSPSHDELQAIAGGIAGIALAEGRTGDVAIAGVAPFVHADGTWREGYIVNPLGRLL